MKPYKGLSRYSNPDKYIPGWASLACPVAAQPTSGIVSLSLSEELESSALGRELCSEELSDSLEEELPSNAWQGLPLVTLVSTPGSPGAWPHSAGSMFVMGALDCVLDVVSGTGDGLLRKTPLKLYVGGLKGMVSTCAQAWAAVMYGLLIACKSGSVPGGTRWAGEFEENPKRSPF